MQTNLHSTDYTTTIGASYWIKPVEHRKELLLSNEIYIQLGKKREAFGTSHYLSKSKALRVYEFS